MNKIALLLISIFCAPVWAGISITLNVPDTLTPTTDSIVRNPVTLEASAFDAEQLNDSNTLELDEYQWFVGQWDEIQNGNSAIYELPFTFTLNGSDYTKIGVSQYGYVTLLPASYELNSYSSYQHISRDWDNPNSGTFQLAIYPTIFPLARNNVYHIDWNMGQFTVGSVEETKTDVVLIKNLENQVVIYSQHQLQRYDSNSTKTPYSLEQVVILNSNGDVQIHFDTEFPFETMMVDTITYEESHAALGLRFYSGIMIPRRVVDEVTLSPVPMVNNITTNGAKSFSFIAESLNALTTEDLPTDGSNLDAATPVLLEGVELANADIPYANVFTSGSETLTLPSNLNSGEEYNWSVRQLATYTEGSGDSLYISDWISDWSEINRFSIEKNDDDDDLLGSINPLLLILLSPLLFFRKQK